MTYSSPQIGVPLIELASVASTNSYASALIQESDIQEGTAIYTTCQTAGKGQRNNHWASEKGKNIATSILLKPSFLELRQQFALNMISSLAVKACLQQSGIDGVQIKWPNDVYIYRKKVSGILIQNSLHRKSIQQSIVGIGLNVNQEYFDPNLPNPTSMALEGNKVYDLSEVRDRLYACLQVQYESLIRKEITQLTQLYLEDLYQLGEKREYELPSGQRFEGIIQNIDPYGQLLMEIDGSQRAFQFNAFKYIL